VCFIRTLLWGTISCATIPARITTDSSQHRRLTVKTATAIWAHDWCNTLKQDRICWQWERCLPVVLPRLYKAICHDSASKVLNHFEWHHKISTKFCLNPHVSPFMIKEHHARKWSGFIWLMIRFIVGQLWIRWKTLRWHYYGEYGCLNDNQFSWRIPIELVK